MNFGFVTCVQLGLSCMEAIYQVGGSLDLVITLEDGQAKEKSGRVYLDDFCKSKNIPLLKTSHINNNECIDTIIEHNIDWLFVIGWSQIAKKNLLMSAKKGVLGIHPTLLPEGRGRASIPWAIIKGLDKTGVTLFKLDEGVDTGEILEQKVIPLSKDMTATKLYDLVNSAHIELIENVFNKLESDSLALQIQNEINATEWPGRVAKDGEINLEGSVFEAEKLVRAVTRPYPGAFIINGKKKIIIWKSEVREFSPSSSSAGYLFKDGYLHFIDYEQVTN